MSNDGSFRSFVWHEARKEGSSRLQLLEGSRVKITGRIWWCWNAVAARLFRKPFFSPFLGSFFFFFILPRFFAPGLVDGAGIGERERYLLRGRVGFGFQQKQVL